MTELVIGTKKGLFVLDGDPAGEFTVRARAFAGEPIDYAIRDPHSGRLLAGVTSPFYGPKIFYAEDPDGEWTQAEGVALPSGGEEALERIWVIAPGENGVVYAGGDPGVLFESDDGGANWRLNAALWEHKQAESWQPGGGGLCLHSIVPWPGDPDRLAVAVSAAGVWLTEDRGRTWRRGNKGIVPRYLPEEARENATQLCVHHMDRARARPERLFLQFHGGVYRSDDAGESWTQIGGSLPSDFGFPMVLDPADPDSAFVIPLTADRDRVTPDGRVRVYETRDAGASWTAREDGLPQDNAYLTVLRLAFAGVGRGRFAAALLRGHLGRGVRVRRRRREVADRRRPATSGLLAQRRLSVRRAASRYPWTTGVGIEPRALAKPRRRVRPRSAGNQGR